MWIVTWLGRQDPDPRVRPLSSVCATFTSAKELASRVALNDGVRVKVERVDGDVDGVVIGASRVRVVDERGICAHELRAEWCFYCQEGAAR